VLALAPIPTIPCWQLIPDGPTIHGTDPTGRLRFATQDFDTVLQSLGDATPEWERVAVCAGAWLGIHPATIPVARRLWAYVCSPFAAPTAAQQQQHRIWAQQLARLAWSHGFWPIVPHLYAPQFLDDTDPAERTLGLAWGVQQLAQCSLVYVLAVPPSPGMQAELAALTPDHVVCHVPLDALPPLPASCAQHATSLAM
jgi:hypothetical protein